MDLNYLTGGIFFRQDETLFSPAERAGENIKIAQAAMERVKKKTEAKHKKKSLLQQLTSQSCNGRIFSLL